MTGAERSRVQLVEEERRGAEKRSREEEQRSRGAEAQRVWRQSPVRSSLSECSMSDVPWNEGKGKEMK